MPATVNINRSGPPYLSAAVNINRSGHLNCPLRLMFTVVGALRSPLRLIFTTAGALRSPLRLSPAYKRTVPSPKFFSVSRAVLLHPKGCQISNSRRRRRRFVPVPAGARSDFALPLGSSNGVRSDFALSLGLACFVPVHRPPPRFIKVRRSLFFEPRRSPPSRYGDRPPAFD